MAYLFLIAAFILNALANVLLKVAGKGVVSGAPLVPQLLTNVPLIIGLICFIGNAGFYFLALRSVPLSVAYPFMVGMTFLIVTLSSILFLRETIVPLQYVGFACIVFGLALAVTR